MDERTHAFKPLEESILAPHTGYASPFSSAQKLLTGSPSAPGVTTNLRFVSAGAIRADIDMDTVIQKAIVRGIADSVATSLARISGQARSGLHF